MSTLAEKAEIRKRLRTETVASRAASLLDPTPDPTFDNPVIWAQRALPSWRGSDYQEEILVALGRYRRCSVRGPHGLGKSATASIAVHWFADTRERAGKDWKVVTTAGAWRQLSHYLWPEIRKWNNRLVTREYTRYELLTLELKLRYGQAFAVASDDPQNIEGAHADEILYIIDEGKAVIPAVWDAVEGALSTGNAYVLSISTPGKAEGRFFDIQSRKPGYDDWWVRHVTLEEAIRAGRISLDWAERRKLQWGENSPIYLNRVLGEFSTTDAEGVIPLDWIDAAQDRWDEYRERGLLQLENIHEIGPLINIGVDISSTGGDDTIAAPRYGLVVPQLYELHGRRIDGQSSTMVKTGELVTLARNAKIELPRLPNNSRQKTPRPYFVADVIGVGTGVVDRLREMGHPVDAFNGSSGTKAKDRTGELLFLNRRAEAYWNLRDLLDPAYGEAVALPRDDALTGDLSAPMWETTSMGKVKVEDKDSIRARLGRSPDRGDAVVMSYHGKNPKMSLSEARPVSLGKSSSWRRR